MWRGAKVEARTTDSWTPLIKACFYGHAEVARFLLDEGAAIEAKQDKGCTSLYFASQEGHIEVVKLLIAHGAVVDAPDNEGALPLFIASQFGHALAARELLAHGANPNVSMNDWAPLNVAADQGHTEAMCELLRKSETDINTRSGDGRTPLMLACEYGRLKATTVLIGHSADFTLLDDAGLSALAYAKTRASKADLTESERTDAKAVVAVLKASGAT